MELRWAIIHSESQGHTRAMTPAEVNSHIPLPWQNHDAFPGWFLEEKDIYLAWGGPKLASQTEKSLQTLTNEVSHTDSVHLASDKGKVQEEVMISDAP